MERLSSQTDQSAASDKHLLSFKIARWINRASPSAMYSSPDGCFPQGDASSLTDLPGLES